MNRYTGIGLIAALVLLLDQWTKQLTIKYISFDQVIPVISGFFNLVHVRNRGAAFGFLNNPDTSWQVWFFIGVSLVASVVILYIARSAKKEDRLLFLALGLVLGGALGNLVDRVLLGEVVDFLDVYYRTWHWPSFNVADSAICLGAFLTFIFMLKDGKGKTGEGDTGKSACGPRQSL